MSTSLGRPRESRPATTLTSQTINVTNLLAQVLGQYIPGYTYITEVLRDKLGIDADRVLAVLGFFFGGWALFNYLQNIVIPRILSTFTSSLLLERNDQSYEDFLSWIAKRRVFQYARSIRIVGRLGEAKSTYQNPYSPFSRGETFLAKSLDTDFSYVEDQDENILFDFAALEAKRPLVFEPEAGTYFFIWRRRLFLFSKDHDPLVSINASDRGRGSRTSGESNTIRLTCIGLSTTPLKDLMETARAENYEDQAFRTSIFRPGGMNRFERYTVGPSPWVKIASRPSRPLDSVVLNKDQKERILKDWNSFLHPSRQAWFAARGIPYRRGYLFSGPPGTGKTSICYSLAGVFGVDVFVVALGDVHMGDSDLSALLTDLPARCIVILEDIDCVGSTRDEDEDKEQEMLDPFSFGRGRRNREMSLSGLLNAIDGVGSHEGHILVMTTNYPDSLDDALKRPGRIDMHVPFKLASHRQIMEIFVRIFSVSEDQNQNAGRKRTGNTVDKACLESSELTDGRTCPYMTNAELLVSARQFAESFEEELFSPAEIQGFLLMHKSEPYTALEEVSAWIPATLAAREKAKADAEKAKERRARKRAEALARRDALLAAQGQASGGVPTLPSDLSGLFASQPKRMPKYVRDLLKGKMPDLDGVPDVESLKAMMEAAKKNKDTTADGKEADGGEAKGAADTAAASSSKDDAAVATEGTTDAPGGQVDEQAVAEGQQELEANGSEAFSSTSSGSSA